MKIYEMIKSQQSTIQIKHTTGITMDQVQHQKSIK